MTLDYILQDRWLTVKLSGELDHHRAREMTAEISRQIDIALPHSLTLDLSGLTFTDSSGIAVLLQASRRMAQLQGTLAVSNVPAQARKVFQAAGLERLIHFE